MSENFGRKMLAILCVTLTIPFGLVIGIFEILGIGDYVYPIVLPIFAFTGFFIFFIIGCVLFVVQKSTSTSITSTAPLYQTSQPPAYVAETFYKIPKNCPSCGNELQLSRVEWRDDYTVVCPTCFEDVKITSF